MTTDPDLFRATCYAQDLSRHASAAEALLWISPDMSAARLSDAVVDLVKLADALGFVIVPKAEADAVLTKVAA